MVSEYKQANAKSFFLLIFLSLDGTLTWAPPGGMCPSGRYGDPVVPSARGCMNGLPDSFAWGNFSVLAVGLWAVGQRDSVDAVLMVSLLSPPSAPSCEPRVMTVLGFSG